MSTPTRVFLGFSVLVWLPYGIFSFFQPHYIGEIAQVVAGSPTATTEIRAMYGGLEAAIGALCLAALMRPELVRPALIMLFCISLGLASTRAVGLMVDGSTTGYTIGALIFETLNTAFAYLLLASPKHAPAV